MCQIKTAPRPRFLAGCTCGCCGCGCGPGVRRFFFTRDEQERLENYRDQLKKELAGVEEWIKECGEK